MFSVASPNLAQALILHPGKNLISGIRPFERQIGQATSLEVDILNVASTIFAADIAVPRGERELFSRRVELTLPVVNFRAFAAIADRLTTCLYLLTNDYWDLQFTQAGGKPEEYCEWPQGEKTTLLFSGGLDSAAQAILFREASEPVAFVSHDSGNQAVSASTRLILEKISQMPGPKIESHIFRVRGQNHRDFHYPSDHEPSQRARSFLFAALGALVARRMKSNRVLMFSENGQMAIHLPLSAARIGAFSTHTAHPEVLASFGNIFSELLGIKISVENPSLYLTKAEVVSRLCHGHRDVVGFSVSCWKASRVSGDTNHCGECIPCLIRRIALEQNGYTDSVWKRDLFAEDVLDLPSDDMGKTNLVELAGFAIQFESTTDAELTFDFPDLSSEYFDQAKAISMYRRFSAESCAVLSRYSNLDFLLK